MPVDNPRIRELLKRLIHELEEEFDAELSKRLADSRKVSARESASARVRKSLAKKALNRRVR
jgi:hypothetical protein